MSPLRKKVLLLFIVCCTSVLSVTYTAFGQEATATPTPTPTSAPNTEKLNDLKNQIAELEEKLSATQSKEKTLSSEISVLDNQIRLTELRIDATKEEIDELTQDINSATGRIDKLEGSLDDITKVLINRVVATYQIGSIEPIEVLVASDDMTDFFHRANYLKVAQENDKKLMYSTVQAKNDYEHQKNIFEDKKQKVVSLEAELEGYTAQLDKDKSAKKEILAVTQNDEKKFQQILAQARAEFQAIQGIVAGKGTEVDVGAVSEGQQIASIIPSASCNSSGPHVHFIVKDGGSAQNPFNYLKPVDHNNESNGDPFNPSGDWNWPIDSPIQFNQGYGSDTWYVRTFHPYPFHDGIDISGPSYAVKAVKSGTAYRGSYSGNGGCALPYMKVKHEDGKETFYLHVYSAF